VDEAIHERITGTFNRKILRFHLQFAMESLFLFRCMRGKFDSLYVKGFKAAAVQDVAAGKRLVSHRRCKCFRKRNEVDCRCVGVRVLYNNSPGKNLVAVGDSALHNSRSVALRFHKTFRILSIIQRQLTTYCHSNFHLQKIIVVDKNGRILKDINCQAVLKEA